MDEDYLLKNQKPKKILYKNQEDVLNQVILFLKDKLANISCIKEAYLSGSVASNKFGVYKKPWKDNGVVHFGSDLDLIIVINKDGKLPLNWKLMELNWGWGDIYNLGKFEYQKNVHNIEAVLCPSLESAKVKGKVIRLI